MGIWNPTVYLVSGMTGGESCIGWGQVDDYDDVYEDTNYWWTSHAKYGFVVQWNNGCAIRLLIDKCNSLQAQVDALSGVDVTMDAIIAAMLDVDYMQIQHFTAITDAYHVALWDDWFDAGLHTELVRAFKRTK